MLKKFPPDKINITKNAAHHSFTFNSKFFHELKHTRLISLKVSLGFSIFDSVSFLLSLYFCSIKSMNSFTVRRHNSFQKKNNISDTQFCSQTSDF